VVLPHQAAIPHASAAFEKRENGGTAGGYAFVDKNLESRVATLGRRIVEYATIEPDPRTFESDQR